MKAVRPSLRSSDAVTVAHGGAHVLLSGRRRLVGGEHDLAALPHREGSVLADLGGQGAGLLDGLAGLDEAGHQPERVGPLGRERLAGEDRLHRGGPPDRPREAEQAARAGDQVALHLGEAERRAGGRHDEIAGEHDLAAAGGGQPVDGGDDRLGPLAVGEAGEATAWCRAAPRLIAFSRRRR